MYVLGIDPGTQGAKTLVFDLEKAAVVAEASKPYDMIEGLPDGRREQDAALWIKAVDYTIRDCLKQLGEQAFRVAAIGVRGQQYGLEVLGSENSIIRPPSFGVISRRPSRAMRGAMFSIKSFLQGSNILSKPCTPLTSFKSYFYQQE